LIVQICFFEVKKVRPSLIEWKNSIVVTGANGFIGMNLVEHILVSGFENLKLEGNVFPKASNVMVIGVDLSESLERKLANRFTGSARYRFLNHTDFLTEFDSLSEENKPLIVFHNGACSSTTETRKQIFDTLNTGYSKKVWDICAKLSVPLIYASSAATYGSGENGFFDNPQLNSKYKPLNLYGDSKLNFDKWVTIKNDQKELCPPCWFGLRYFNVYGPYERHKGSQASMVTHGYDQMTRSAKVKLFESNTSQYSHGNQLRDFIFVKDIVKYSLLLANIALKQTLSKNAVPEGWKGCFVNLGTGKAETWNFLAQCIAESLEMPLNIEYIPIPETLKNQYQNFTEANLETLKKLGLPSEFTSLKNGIKETVQRYLCRGL
jgi:ADP-L-glycero-D-manno-heptose 6-epimerase